MALWMNILQMFNDCELGSPCRLIIALMIDLNTSIYFLHVQSAKINLHNWSAYVPYK